MDPPTGFDSRTLFTLRARALCEGPAGGPGGGRLPQAKQEGGEQVEEFEGGEKPGSHELGWKNKPLNILICSVVFTDHP